MNAQKARARVEEIKNLRNHKEVVELKNIEEVIRSKIEHAVEKGMYKVSHTKTWCPAFAEVLKQEGYKIYDCTWTIDQYTGKWETVYTIEW